MSALPSSPPTAAVSTRASVGDGARGPAAASRAPLQPRVSARRALISETSSSSPAPGARTGTTTIAAASAARAAVRIAALASCRGPVARPHRRDARLGVDAREQRREGGPRLRERLARAAPLRHGRGEDVERAEALARQPWRGRKLGGEDLPQL